MSQFHVRSYYQFMISSSIPQVGPSVLYSLFSGSTVIRLDNEKLRSRR